MELLESQKKEEKSKCDKAKRRIDDLTEEKKLQSSQVSRVQTRQVFVNSMMLFFLIWSSYFTATTVINFFLFYLNTSLHVIMSKE